MPTVLVKEFFRNFSGIFPEKFRASYFSGKVTTLAAGYQPEKGRQCCQQSAGVASSKPCAGPAPPCRVGNQEETESVC